MSLQVGEVPYSLLDCLIATYDRVEDEYGTPIRLDAGQQFQVDPQHDTDQMREFGQIGHVLSINTHANITVGAGGMSFAGLSVMIGTAVSSTGSGATLIRELNPRAAGRIMPYFGAIGVAPSNDGSILVCGVRAIMLDKMPVINFDGNTNQFITQQNTGRAVAINGMVYKFKAYATEDLWLSNKPDTGEDFKAWFGVS